MNKKKKIGILTQPLSNNYGGLLQNYALQQVLISLGHTPITLSVSFPLRNRYYQLFRSLCANFYKNFFLGQNVESIIPFVPKKADLLTVSKNMRNFVSKNIYSTEPLAINGLNKKDFLQNFDAFIVGSDQVWRPSYSPNLTTYYLDFLPEDLSPKRIAYAASFGVDYWEYSSKQTRICKELVNKFNSTSVREESGIYLCRENFGIEAFHVLDPTLLLDKKNYIDLAKGLNKPKNNKTLLVYVLDMNSRKRKIIDQISKSLNLSINLVMPEKKLSYSCNDIEKCIFPPVEEWIKGFMETDFVVTDSFHGTAFSIIFNKPFISITNTGRGRDRFRSLLESLNISERLIDEGDEVTNEIMDKKIDYSSVNYQLDKMKKESIEFLSSSLG